MKHIVQFSGGKDSTAMLLMMLERGMPVDEIIFCDTGKEFPGMYKHIAEVESFIAKYGKTITTLKAEKPFDYWLLEHVKTKGKHEGTQGYGWARPWRRWCTRILKQAPTNEYLKKYSKEKTVVYIGIAYDEPKRHEKLMVNQVHPLYDWHITERQALEYCYEKGFHWDGLYEHFKRVSCWCCPLQSIKSLKTLWELYPELWDELKAMENKTKGIIPFRIDGKSLSDLEIRFASEMAQMELGF